MGKFRLVLASELAVDFENAGKKTLLTMPTTTDVLEEIVNTAADLFERGNMEIVSVMNVQPDGLTFVVKDIPSKDISA